MTLKKRLRKFGSRFAFEFFLASMHAEIIKGLQKYLKSIQPGDIPKMVAETRFPPLGHLAFSEVSDNAEHLERIPLVSKDVPPGSPPPKPGLMDYIAEARPDLATAIQDMGMPGAEYLAKLRRHLIDLAKHPEKALGKSTEYKTTQEMVMATCDKCQKSWPVPKAEASSLDKCPFCGE